jgi:hypothetical protein
MSADLAALSGLLLGEVEAVIAAMPGAALEPLVTELVAARRIALYGQGRTGLVMQGLTMRLYHLGRDAHWVGAMNAPPLGPGDLFLVNAALGDLPTGLALIASAKPCSSFCARRSSSFSPSGCASALRRCGNVTRTCCNRRRERRDGVIACRRQTP